ncbi:hypothetical protein MHY85_19090 [Cellulomonas sp. ACRRI]|uniref:hypothetical protein n=1 Tax=Cellulomonas sp. ACRRI TaxID=2918188 RepID=UPI001EF1E3D7|nr:hypothetical protein [Cellulomonas sp. ACRRI]MCG7288068.1 hypothetical protein [Cellulomonas sp. ACRRI]
MDPTDVLRTLWQQRWYVLPALLLTLAAAAYVYGFAPRSYEATSTYALVNPAVPTTEELERDPALAALNGDNPYLRSADTNLITDAVIARLGSASTVRQLEADGVGTDYGVGPGVGGTGFVVDITGVGPTPEAAIATATAVGTVLAAELEDLQRVNGADDRYLFTPLLLTPPDDATEQFSSRLRAVIIVLLGGAVLVFGAASLGRWRSGARAQRAAARAADAGSPGGPGAARETGPEPAVDEASAAAPGPTADATSRAASGPTASATSDAASEPAAGTAAQAAPGPAAGATPESVADPATDADEPTAAEPDAEPPTEPADPGPVATPRAPRAPRAAGRVPARAARGTGAPTARRPR